jgi:hypothetical protein
MNNPWDQPRTLEIGTHNDKHILIVNSGFGALGELRVRYGIYRQHGGAPLGLNLSKYSAFQLTFAGLASSSTMGINVQVSQHGSTFDCGTDLSPISPNQFSRPYQFSNFHPKFDPNVPVDGLQLLLGGGGTVTFGLVLFEAIP